MVGANVGALVGNVGAEVGDMVGELGQVPMQSTDTRSWKYNSPL